MSDDSGRRLSVIVECDLDEPPVKVWRALTVPDLVAAWLGCDGIRPEPGSRFSASAGIVPAAGMVDGEVLVVEPERLLRLRWRHAAGADGPTLDSIVTFALTPTADGGTHLRLVHDGFRLEQQRTVAAVTPLPRSSMASARRRPVVAPTMRWAA